MLSFIKNLFGQKKKDDLMTVIKKILENMHSIEEYADFVATNIDNLSKGFETSFDYQDNDNIYVVLANIYAKFSDDIQFNEQEEHYHQQILMLILVRNDEMDEQYRWNEFIESISYFENKLASIDMSSKSHGEYLFTLCSQYAQYLYPNSQAHNLLAQTIYLTQWVPIIALLAKEQKRFYSQIPLNFIKLLKPIDFFAETLGGRQSQMDTSPYDGHPFECACGQNHNFNSLNIEVLRELPKMRLVLACPVTDGYITCVKIKGWFKFKGFESLFGTKIEEELDSLDTLSKAINKKIENIGI